MVKFDPHFNIWLWRIIRRKLPTSLNWVVWGMSNIIFCCFCINQVESLEHILFECLFFRRAWQVAFFLFTIAWFGDSIKERRIMSRKNLQINFFIKEWSFYWHIWIFRNKIPFQILIKTFLGLSRDGEIPFPQLGPLCETWWHILWKRFLLKMHFAPPPSPPRNVCFSFAYIRGFENSRQSMLMINYKIHMYSRSSIFGSVLIATYFIRIFRYENH